MDRIKSFFSLYVYTFIYIFYIAICSTIVLAYSIRNIHLDYFILFTYAIFFAILVVVFLEPIKELSLYDFLNSFLLISILYFFLMHYGGNGFYTSNELYKILEHGNFDSDSSFHIAIAESIKNYGYSSTLLHGNPILHYHVGSHYLLAILSIISQISVIELFPYQNTFFTSLFITFCIIYQSKKSSSNILILIPFIILLSLNKLETFIYNFDISTPVSLCFAFLLISRIESKNYQFLDYLLLIAIFLSKVSVGSCAFGIYGTYKVLFSNDTKIKRLMIFIVLCSLFILLFYFTSDNYSKSESLKWEFNSLYNQLLQQEKRDAKIYIFFILPFFLTIVAAIRRNWEICISGLFLLCIGFLAINTSFNNRSHMHFIYAINWLSIILLSCINFQIKNKISKWLLTLGVVLYIVVYAPYIKKKLLVVSDGLSIYPKTTDATLYIQKLIELRKRKGNFLIEVPEEEKDFWNHWAYNELASRYFMAFWIPMLSGKPAFNGYNSEFMYEKNVAWYPPGSYGYSSYYYKKLDTKQFDKIITIRKKENQIIEEQRILNANP